MKKTNRLTAIFLLAVMAVFLFAGCKNNNSTPSESGSGIILPSSGAPSSPSSSATPGAPDWGTPTASETVVVSPTTPISGEGMVTTSEYSFTLPAGFTDDGTGTYYAPNYPTDASNVSVTTGSTDPTFSSYTSASLEALYEETFASTVGEEVDIEMVGFTYTTVSGKIALKAAMSYTLYGFEVYQMQCAVQTDSQIITFTYTQMMGEGWEAEFENSANSIVVY